MSQTILELVPLAEEHRANRDALHSEFSQVVIDGEEIERITLDEMVLAEQGRELTEAFTGFAQTLTVEQRNELMEMAERFHRR